MSIRFHDQMVINYLEVLTDIMRHMYSAKCKESRAHDSSSKVHQVERHLLSKSFHTTVNQNESTRLRTFSLSLSTNSTFSNSLPTILKLQVLNRVHVPSLCVR